MTGRSESLHLVASRNMAGDMQADVRQHRIVIDESAKYGGADRGANPVELMLVGLATASLVVMDMVAGQRVTSGVRLLVHAELNVERIMGADDTEPLLTEIELTWEVPSDRDPDRIRVLLPELAKRRPGQALLDSAGRAMEVVVSMAADVSGEVPEATQMEETDRIKESTT